MAKASKELTVLSRNTQLNEQNKTEQIGKQGDESKLQTKISSHQPKKGEISSSSSLKETETLVKNGKEEKVESDEDVDDRGYVIETNEEDVDDRGYIRETDEEDVDDRGYIRETDEDDKTVVKKENEDRCEKKEAARMKALHKIDKEEAKKVRSGIITGASEGKPFEAEIVKKGSLKPRSYRLQDELGAGSYKKTFTGEQANSRTQTIKNERAVSIFKTMTQKLKKEIYSELQIHRHLQEAKDKDEKSVSHICISKPIYVKGRLIGVTGKKYSGGDAEKFLKELLTNAQKRQVALDMLKGVSQVHQQEIVHRDLKPDNFLVEKDGNNNIKVSVADFGKSVPRNKASPKDALYMTYRPFGPAMATKTYEVEKNDSFSMGIVLYQVFTGTSEKDLLFAYEKILADALQEFPLASPDQKQDLTEDQRKQLNRQVSKRAKDLLIEVRGDSTDTKTYSKCDGWPNFDKVPEYVKPLIRSLMRDDIKERISVSAAYDYLSDINSGTGYWA